MFNGWCERGIYLRSENRKMVGFAEVDIEVPRELWSKFEEMPPLFYNKPVSSEAVPQHMKDHLAKNKRKPMYDQQKLVGALSAEKILLYVPLLKWYLDQGLKITAVHRTINYKRGMPFTWFVNKVTEKNGAREIKTQSCHCWLRCLTFWGIACTAR